jgi:light-regulated signal transduction histidine kinase (bacteriophytochrome)
VRWEIHPWYDGSEQIGGIVLFSEVVTESKLAHEALNQKVAELGRSNDRLAQIADAASHGLGEPLDTLSGTVQRLEQSCRGRLTPQVDEALILAGEAVRKMQTLMASLRLIPPGG